MTGGTLQYGDATTGAANRLAGDLRVSGTGSTLAVQGTASLGVAGNVGMADHTILDLTAGTRGAALRADTVTLGADVSFRLGGIYSTSPAEVLLIDTTNGISGDFARISAGGAAGAVDYLSVNTRKSPDNRQYLARYGLTWTAGNSLAHGTFTLANASDRFTVGAALADQAANAASGWNGRTLTKAGAGTLALGGANTYSGGTRITGGTLEVERDANLGAAAGGLALEGGGMLATTASFDTARAITVTQSGGFDVAANTTLGLTGLLAGSGDLIKAGEGVLDLKGDSSGFSGRTLVNGGRVAVNGRLGGSFTVADGGVLGQWHPRRGRRVDHHRGRRGRAVARQFDRHAHHRWRPGGAAGRALPGRGRPRGQQRGPRPRHRQRHAQWRFGGAHRRQRQLWPARQLHDHGGGRRAVRPLR